MTDDIREQLNRAIHAANAAADKAVQMDIHSTPPSRKVEAWATVARAWAEIAAASAVVPADVVAEAGYINPHQIIGVLSDDEINTIMALRRGTATVVSHERLAQTVTETIDQEESFQTWTTRQLEKLAAAVRELESRYERHARERVDPLGLDARIASSDSWLPERIVWCLMERQDLDSVTFPPSMWRDSENGKVSIRGLSSGAVKVSR